MAFSHVWKLGILEGWVSLKCQTEHLQLGFSSMGLSQGSQKSCMIDAFPLIESAVNDVYKRTRHKLHGLL